MEIQRERAPRLHCDLEVRYQRSTEVAAQTHSVPVGFSAVTVIGVQLNLGRLGLVSILSKTTS